MAADYGTRAAPYDDVITGTAHYTGPAVATPSYSAISSPPIPGAVVPRYVFNATTAADRTIITTTYVVTFIVGFVGNALVLYVLASLGIRGISDGRGTGNRPVLPGGGGGAGAASGRITTLPCSADPFRVVAVRIKSVANCYIANLALADILFVCTLPLFCWATYTSDWPFGTASCKAAYALRENNKFVGVYVLVALSVDRYLASHYDLGRWRTLNVGRAVCVGVWISSALTTTPYWIYAQVISVNKGSRRSCRVLWPTATTSDVSQAATTPGGNVAFAGDTRSSAPPGSSSSWSTTSPSMSYHSTSIHVWTWFQFVVEFLIPFALIVAAYAALGVRLRRLLAARSTGNSGTAGDAAVDGRQACSACDRKRAARKKSTAVKRPGRAMTRMSIVVTVTFLVTQLPYHVIEIFNAAKSEKLHLASRRHYHQSFEQRARDAANSTLFSSREVDDVTTTGGGTRRPVAMAALSPGTDVELSVIVWLSAVAKMLQFVSSCLNPVIYGLMNRNYRALYNEALCRRSLRCCKFNAVANRQRRPGRLYSDTTTRGTRRRAGHHPGEDAALTSSGRNPDVRVVVDGSAGDGDGPSGGGGGVGGARRRRFLLDVEYCRDGGRDESRILQRESISTSPGAGQTSGFNMTTVSCLELTRVDSTMKISVPVCAASDSVDSIRHEHDQQL